MSLAIASIGVLARQLADDVARTHEPRPSAEAAEKARDAPIKSLEQAAVRGTSSDRRTPQS